MEKSLKNNLDLMHIEKIFVVDLFNAIMNVARKTQDNENMRMDLSFLCLLTYLEMKLFQSERLKIQMQDTLKMLDFNVLNLARCSNVTKSRMHGMKSQNYHVFIVLCCNTLLMEDFVKLEQNILII